MEQAHVRFQYDKRKNSWRSKALPLRLISWYWTPATLGASGVASLTCAGVGDESLSRFCACLLCSALAIGQWRLGATAEGRPDSVRRSMMVEIPYRCDSSCRSRLDASSGRMTPSRHPCDADKVPKIAARRPIV